MKKYIYLFISLMVISCGARKVNKDEKVETETTIETVVSKDTVKEDIIETIKYDVTTEEIEACPIDTTKEMIVNGQKFFNTRILIKKKKDNTLYVKDKKASKTSSKQAKKITNKQVVSKTKTVDKEEVSFWRTYLIFYLLLILTLYLLYRRFKSKLF
jgi:hypothetical protein